MSRRRILSLMVVALQWILSACDEATLTINSINAPDYYQADVTSFVCSFHFNEPKNPSSFSLRLNYGSVDEKQWGCVKVKSSKTLTQWRDNPSGGVTEKFSCDQLPIGNLLHVVMNISMPLMFHGNFSCVLEDENFDVISEAYKSVPELRVAPTQLTLSVVENPSYAGDTISFECESAGGSPPSQFEYKLKGNIVQELTVEVDPSYNGQELSCTDVEHQNYKGHTFVHETEVLTVYYLQTKVPEQHLNVDPSKEAVLNCTVDSNLPLGHQLTYSWYHDGNEIADAVDATYRFFHTENTTEDNYSCRVSTDERITGVEVTLIVHWGLPTTPTLPTLPTTTINSSTVANDAATQASSNTTVIVVVVVVIVVVLIVVIVVIVIRKRSSSASQANGAKKGSAARAPEKADVESGKGDGATEPMITKTESDGESKPTEQQQGQQD